MRTGEARQEEAFMDDSGLGNIVRPFAGVRERDRSRVRLAWKPWVRGFVLGALVGAAVVFAYFLWRMNAMPDWSIPDTYGGK